jgi:hypothetical protein
MSLSVDAMLASTNDERGTVRALAREIEEAHADRQCCTSTVMDTDLQFTGGINYRFSNRVVKAYASAKLYKAIFDHLQLLLPNQSLRSHIQSGDGICVPRQTAFFEWVVIRGRRYTIHSTTVNPMNAVVAVRAGESTYAVARLEQLLAFRLDASELPIVRLAVLRYLTPSTTALPADSVWHST